MTIEDQDAAPMKNPKFGAWKLTSTPQMIANLVDDHFDDESVLLGAAWNPVTWEKTLDLIKYSDFPKVRAAAENRLEVVRALNESKTN